MKCPKCGADAALVHEQKDKDLRPFTDLDGTTTFPTIDDILDAQPKHIFDEAFSRVFECSTHGEFGVKSDGVPEFTEPDTWVEGPNGEKLFRM